MPHQGWFYRLVWCMQGFILDRLLGCAAKLHQNILFDIHVIALKNSQFIFECLDKYQH